MVKMLLDAGAGPEGANEDGQTALMLAIKTGETPIVDMLIKAGAKVNVVERLDNQTLDVAACAKECGRNRQAAACERRQPHPRARYSDWPSQITSEPRAVSSRWRLDRLAVCGAQRVLRLRSSDARGRRRYRHLPTPEGVTPVMTAIDNENIAPPTASR